MNWKHTLIALSSAVAVLGACREDRPFSSGEPATRKRVAGAAVVQTVRYYAGNQAQNGDGTETSPWTLSFAFSSANTILQPGDTVWLLGGDYTETYVVTKQGTAGNPIVYRQAPGQIAKLARPGDISCSSHPTTLRVDKTAEWTEFWDFEVSNTSTASRTATQSCVQYVPKSIWNQAPNTKFVNLVLHDGTGLLNEPNTINDQPQPYNVLISGCIIYNGGWDDPVLLNNQGDTISRGHGHGLYLKNDDLTPSHAVIASDNVIFNNYGHGIQIYTNPGEGGLKNIILRRNVVFNNGSISRWGAESNLGYYGLEQGQDLYFEDNNLYMSPLEVLNANNPPYPNSLDINLVYRSSGALQVLNGHRSGNYIIGGSPNRVGYSTDDGWQEDAPDVLGSAPGSQVTRWSPTEADSDRAIIVVYSNTPGSVEFTEFLNLGESYVLKNAQNFRAAAIDSGVFDGSITLPLNTTPAQPVGAPRPAVTTSPSFNVFVLTRTAAAQQAETLSVSIHGFYQNQTGTLHSDQSICYWRGDVTGGSAPYSYQWYQNGAPVGTNSPDLDLPIERSSFTLTLIVTSGQASGEANKPISVSTRTGQMCF